MDMVVDLLSSPLVWIVLVLLYMLKQGIHFVPQNRGYVIYTFGKYDKTLSSGLNFIIPFIQRVAAVRNAIGSMELDECFQSRDAINATILAAMTEATQPWGVMVTRYEIKDISPPQSIREDMEKQMTAEREKRSVILTAEGVKTAAITEAEGLKAARVLDAEAAKAEQVLAAEADKEAQILQAMGKATAIRLVAEADASALKTVGDIANTASGESAMTLQLGREAIAAHRAIAAESTVVLSDGKTSDNVVNTVAQAIAVSSSLKIPRESEGA